MKIFQFKSFLFLSTILLASCAITPKDPLISQYVDCRSKTHESYLKINPRMKIAKTLDYGLILDTSSIYKASIDGIFENSDKIQQLKAEIGHLPCFGKHPTNEQKRWLKPYQIIEANAESSFVFKKNLPIIKTIISQQIAINKNKNRHLLEEIGTRICKEKSGLKYVGFVEHVESKKIQIRVSSASFIGASNFGPSDFQPSIIWDFPSNWYVCE